MSRSSIFNFETLENFRPSWPFGLLVSAALIACIECGLRAVPEATLFPGNSHLGQQYFIEREILPKFPEPKILIFGSSRGRDAVMPRLLDDVLGLPPNSTLNLSVAAGRSTEWLSMYETNRKKFKTVKLVICTLDEWAFSVGAYQDERFALSATLADRMEFGNPGERSARPGETPEEKSARLNCLQAQRNQLLADWAFQMRLKFVGVERLVSGLSRGTETPPLFLDANNMLRKTLLGTHSNPENPGDYARSLSAVYGDFYTQPLYLRNIEKLAELVKANGGRLVLIQLPHRMGHQVAVDKLYPKEYAHFRQTVESLGVKIGAKLYFIQYPIELGLTDADYQDSSHMNRLGTTIFTNWLADKVKSDHLLAPDLRL